MTGASMRVPRWIGAAAAVAVAAGCGDGVKPAHSAGVCAQPSYAVVFFDRSISAAGRATAPGLRDSVAALPNLLACQGDEIHAFVLHGRTRGKAFRFDRSNPLRSESRGGAVIDRALDSLQAVSVRQQFYDEVARGLLRLSHDDTLEVVRAWTDLLGALEVASGQLAEAPDSARLEVYFFSDMHESMPRPRRDFDQHPPRSREEAELWAAQDTAVLADLNLRPDVLSRARVRVFSTPWRNTDAAPYVEVYWRKIFASVGVDPDSVYYH